MLSNTMKISQLIERLQSEMDVHGNLDVVLLVSELGAAVALDGRNINAAVELPTGAKLPQPALVFGLWQDERGCASSSPGQVYQVSALDDAGWSYDRMIAPANEPLLVWKRYLGRDRGFRDEFGRWFVYEGGEKPIEIIPAGILAWRPVNA